MKRVLRKFYLIGILLILMVALGMSIQFHFADTTIQQQAEEKLMLNSQKVIGNIESWLAIQGEVVDSTAAFLEIQEEEANILALLQEQLKRKDTFTSLYFGTPENTMINASGWIPPETFDLRNRPWYQGAVERRGRIYTEAFLNASEDQYIITLAKPVYDSHGSFKGVVAGDISIQEILGFVREQEISENGYAFLLDGTGTVLAHPADKGEALAKPPKVQSTSPLLWEALESQPNGFEEMEIEGEMGFVVYQSVPETDWVVVSFVPSTDYKAAQNQIMMVFLTTVLLTMMGVGLLMDRQRRDVLSPLVRLDKDIQQISMEERIHYRLPLGAQEVFYETRSLLNGVLDKAEEFFEGLQKNEKELKTTHQKLEMFLSLLSDTEEAVFILDDAYRCIYGNQAFYKMMKAKQEDPSFYNPLEEGTYLDKSLLQEVAQSGHWTGERQVMKEDGEKAYLFLRISKGIYQEETYYTVILSDVTAHKKNEKELYYFKYYDPMTKLQNSQCFRERLKKIIQGEETRHQNHALLILNIDDFRIINEAKGFSYGDQVLVSLADRLQNLLKDGDMLARLGNDEFAILKINFSGYEELFYEIQQQSKGLKEKFSIDNQEVFISLSMGIAIYPTDGEGPTEIYGAATSALNNAKMDPSTMFQFYDKKMNRESVMNFEIQHKLRDALAKQEFFLHYQPKVHMKSKQIIGMEALIRWESAGEIISPKDFVPIAEATHLIVPIGEWALRQACGFASQLLKKGKEMPVAVNLSRLQFKNPYILDLVDTVLRETGLPPKLLQLEITEGILMENAEECRWLIEELKERGIIISIDDFGTGYSSLSYLKKFAVDQVKIDRAFIRDIPYKDNGVIAKVIIELSDHFGLDVIAEGVETKEQEAFLLENNCQKAQGYYYYHPMKQEDIQKRLQA